MLFSRTFTTLLRPFRKTRIFLKNYLFYNIGDHVEVRSEIIVDGVQNGHPQKDSVLVRKRRVGKLLSSTDYTSDPTRTKISWPASSSTAQHQTRKNVRYAWTDRRYTFRTTTEIEEKNEWLIIKEINRMSPEDSSCLLSISGQLISAQINLIFMNKRCFSRHSCDTLSTYYITGTKKEHVAHVSDQEPHRVE